MQDTSIAWADWTYNPVRGCSRISPGCQHCYAETIAARFSQGGRCVNDAEGYHSVPPDPFHGFAEFRIVGGRKEAHWTGKVELIESKLMEPLSWRRKAAKFREQHGRKPRAFISMSDLFHESLPDDVIDRVFAVAALTPEINYMFLTKRAERMAEYSNGYIGERIDAASSDLIDQEGGDNLCAEDFKEYEFPLPNVALGVSVESQKYLDRVLQLQRTPAAMKFISYEPALESINWEYPESIWPKGPQMCCPGPSMECGCMGLPVDPPLIHGINMIIIGGESGPGARPFDIAWARQTVEQCRAAGVAPFVKQMGSNPVHRVPAKIEPPESYLAPFAGLKDKKGEDMSEWPVDLHVRQWPEGWN